VRAKESSIRELPSALRAFRWSLDVMLPELFELDLRQLAPALQVPAIFFLGRKDHWIPPEVSLGYIETLIAPFKQIVWFEQAGHELFVDQPAKFNAAMIDVVLPLALARER
jgi:pimeloyl-ACP methyl ester carboxylesterase